MNVTLLLSYYRTHTMVTIMERDKYFSLDSIVLKIFLQCMVSESEFWEGLHYAMRREIQVLKNRFTSNKSPPPLPHTALLFRWTGGAQMQGCKNWILPKNINANWFFWDSHWLEIWKNHYVPLWGRIEGVWMWTLINHIRYLDFHISSDKNWVSRFKSEITSL